MLIEIDFSIPTAREIVEMMTANGWKYSVAQLRTNRGAVLTEEFIRQRWEDQREGFNYIFYRDDAVGELYESFLERYVPPLDATGKLKVRPTVVDETVSAAAMVSAQAMVGATLRRAGVSDQVRGALKRVLGRS